MRTIAKRQQAELEWKRRAEAIDRGEETHLWDVLKERGYVKDVAGLANP